MIIKLLLCRQTLSIRTQDMPSNLGMQGKVRTCKTRAANPNPPPHTRLIFHASMY